MTRIGLCVPWHSPFYWTKALDSLMTLRRPDDVELIWCRGAGWCSARRHTSACEKALTANCEFIWFWGADQVAPPDLLERLWAHVRKGIHPISALVPSRGYFMYNVGTKPFQPLAWRFTPGIKISDYKSQRETPEMIQVIQPNTGLQTIHLTGSGCLMFHRDHLLALERPWFKENVDPITYERFANMDTHFSWRLFHEAGALIRCDTDIKTGHLHDMTIDETFQDRFLDWIDSPKADSSIVERPKK